MCVCWRERGIGRGESILLRIRSLLNDGLCVAAAEQHFSMKHDVFLPVAKITTSIWLVFSVGGKRLACRRFSRGISERALPGRGVYFWRLTKQILVINSDGKIDGDK